MARSVSSIFRTMIGGNRRGYGTSTGGDHSYDFIHQGVMLSEGDVSVDLMRRFCDSEGLGLRGHFQEEGWFDLVGEVNTGIQLYYLVEEGRLWQVIEGRQRRKEAISSIVRRIPGPLFGQASPDLRPMATPLTGGDRAVTETPGGIVREDPPARDVRSVQAPQPVRLFLGEARTLALPPEALFARFVGRAFSMWLDCGPTDRPFPGATSNSATEPHLNGAVRVAGSVATTADISLTAAEIWDAWSLSIGPGAPPSFDLTEP